MAKSVEVEFKGKDSGLTTTMKQAGLTAEQTAAKIKELGKAKVPTGGEGSGDVVKDLAKDLTGNTRAFKKILKGGLVGFVGSELANATGKIAEASDAAQGGAGFENTHGAVSATVVKLGEGLPILGGWVTAGQNIREAFTHEKQQLEEITKQTELQNKYIEYRQSLLDDEKQRWKEVAEFQRKANERIRISGKEGSDRDDEQRQQGREDRITALQQKRDADLSAQDKKTKDFVNDLIKQKSSPDLTPALLDSLNSKQSAAQNANAKAKADINKAYEADRQKEVEASNKEDTDAKKKASDESYKVVQDGEQRIADIQAKARANRLKTAQDGYQAELEAIQRNAEDKKRAIDKTLEQQLKTVAPGYRDDLRNQAIKEKAAVDDEAKSEREAANKGELDDRRKHDIDVQKQARSGQQELLDQQVAQAKTSQDKLKARQAAEANKLKGEFEEKSNALLELQRDPKATQEQINAAYGQLQQFVGQSGKQLDAATRPQAPTHLNNTSNATETNTLTGVAEANVAIPTATDRLTKATDAATNTQKDLIKTLAGVTAALQNPQGGTAPAVLNGVTNGY